MRLFVRLYASYGFFNAVKLFIAISFGSTKLSIPGFKYPVYYRKGTSDFKTLYSVVFARAYEINYYADCKYIIDAGANVGYASLCFARRFPDATIVAIEPDKSNFELLKKNTDMYSNIHCINSGLWSKDCMLKITNTSSEEWAFRVEEDTQPSESSISAVTIATMIKEYNFPKIDLLKIDIEGSEKEVFSGEGFKTWLPVTKHLVIEVHDGLVRGSSRAVMAAIVQYDFSLKRKGENLVFVNHDI